jgi:hypothetical protein
LASPHGGLILVRPGEGDRLTLDLHLLAERLGVCLLRLKGGARLIQRLLRINLLVEEALGALLIQAVPFQVSLGFVFLGLGRRQRSLRLLDLVARLRFLIFQGRLGFCDL